MQSHRPVRRDFTTTGQGDSGTPSSKFSMASPNKTADNVLLLPPKPEPLGEKGWADLGHPGWSLVLWTVFLALPFAYAATRVNTLIFHAVGYEKFMRSPGGLFLNKGIFVLVSLGLILGWYAQLNAEAATAKHEKEEEEVRWWDEVLGILKREQEAGRGFPEDLRQYQASFLGSE